MRWKEFTSISGDLVTVDLDKIVSVQKCDSNFKELKRTRIRFIDQSFLELPFKEYEAVTRWDLGVRDTAKP